MIRTLIIDSDAASRSALQRMLEGIPDMEVCAVSSCGDAAIDLVEEHHPDLLFLDAELPFRDGVAVVWELAHGTPPPLVIFLAPHDGYVANAIDVSAVDYLLKPVQPARLEAALQHYRARRARERAPELAGRHRSEDASGEDGHAEWHGLGALPGGPYTQRLLVKSKDKRHLVSTKDIDRIVAEGNYLRLHVGSASYVMRGTVSEIEAILNPAEFLRIHRHTVVNIDRIQEFSPWFNGEYLVVLRDGTQMKMSRGCRERLFKRKAL